jgi:hypothetical protein
MSIDEKTPRRFEFQLKYASDSWIAWALVSFSILTAAGYLLRF